MRFPGCQAAGGGYSVHPASIVGSLLLKGVEEK